MSPTPYPAQQPLKQSRVLAGTHWSPIPSQLTMEVKYSLDLVKMEPLTMPVGLSKCGVPIPATLPSMIALATLSSLVMLPWLLELTLTFKLPLTVLSLPTPESSGLSPPTMTILASTPLISATPSFTWAVLRTIIVESELMLIIARQAPVVQNPLTSLLVVHRVISIPGLAMELALTVFSRPG